MVPFKGEVSIDRHVQGHGWTSSGATSPELESSRRSYGNGTNSIFTRGDDSKLTHVPKPLPADLNLDAYKEWNRIVGAYCLITLPAMVRGAVPVKERHWMWRAEIERIRNRARGSHTPGSPWKQYPSRMC